MTPNSQSFDRTRLTAAADYFLNNLKIVDGEPTIARNNGYCLLVSPLTYENNSELLATLSAGLIPGPDVQDLPYQLVNDADQVLAQGVTNKNGQFYMDRYLGQTVRIRFQVTNPV